eukprot:7073700-Pyramimonas_sp.AAC.1
MERIQMRAQVQGLTILSRQSIDIHSWECREDSLGRRWPLARGARKGGCEEIKAGTKRVAAVGVE